MTYEDAIKEVDRLKVLVLRLGTEKEKAVAERDSALAKVARLRIALMDFLDAASDFTTGTNEQMAAYWSARSALSKD